MDKLQCLIILESPVMAFMCIHFVMQWKLLKKVQQIMLYFRLKIHLQGQ
ncbi:Uncharacterised protein [Dorea longicatena]|nr:Uncharacterised protein [Dorea longicatena]